MKTTIKRTLATVLAVVMIFSLVPFAGTILGSMSTKVSALETVEGSYDYLVDNFKRTVTDIYGEISYGPSSTYWDANGNTWKFRGLLIEKANSECSLAFEGNCFLPEGIGISTLLTIDDKDALLYTFSGYISYYSIKYVFSGNIDPTKYYYEDELSFDSIDSNIESFKESISYVFSRLIKEMNAMLNNSEGFGLGNLGFIKIDTPKPLKTTPYSPIVDPDEPTVDPDEPTVDPDEPTVDHDEPTVDPDEPTVEPDKPSTDPVKPDDSKTPAEPSQPADAVTPGDSKTTTSDAQNESGVKADTDAATSYKSSANRDGGTSPDTSESMDGIIAAVVTAFVGVTGLIIVKKKEKDED